MLALCMCSMVQFGTAHHPCGENPLRRLIPLTRILNGVIPNGDINAILNVLRTSQPELYRQIQEEWQAYSRCIGLVDTGYFKRSNPTKVSIASSKMAAPKSEKDDTTSQEFEDNVNFLMDLIQGGLYMNADNAKDGQSAEDKN